MVTETGSFESPPPTPQSIERGQLAEDLPTTVDPVANLTVDTTMNIPTTNTPTSSITQTVTKPRFGSDYNGGPVVWIGGPPTEDFSGTSNAVQATPLCFRNLDPVSEMKGYTRRIEGCSIKFKRDNPEFPLVAFAAEALTHMQTYGMDSVFYLKGNDSNGEGAEELFTRHSRYTKSQVDGFVKDKLASKVYDSYSVTCLNESAQWLLNSLDESLKSSIRPQLASNPSGPQLWMMIVAEVQTDSLRRNMQLRKKFETLTLSQFKGENVRDYAQVVYDCLQPLDIDDQLPPTHLMDIVDQLTACTVMDFKIQWMQKRTPVEAFMRETVGKSKDVIALMPNKITYETLLEEAKVNYIALQKQWGNDPTGKEKALLSKVSSLEAKVAQMNQKLAVKGEDKKNERHKNLTCDCCGKKGHIKPNCQCSKCKPKDDDKNSSPKGKWAPPKDGEPKEKKIDDKLMFWCPKCGRGKGRWTNHKVEGHVDNYFQKKKEADANANTNGSPQPAGMMAQTLLSWDDWTGNE